MEHEERLKIAFDTAMKDIREIVNNDEDLKEYISDIVRISNNNGRIKMIKNMLGAVNKHYDLFRKLQPDLNEREFLVFFIEKSLLAEMDAQKYSINKEF